MSENSTGGKSCATLTSNNPFEASRSEMPQYFVDLAKDKRTKNNNLEFLIGWRDFLNHGMWEPLAHLTGSEHVIREFNKKWEQDNLIKTAETLQAVIYRRNAALEKNAERACDSQTAADITKAMGEGGGD